MRLRMGNGISPFFLCFLRAGVGQAIPKSFLIIEEKFLLSCYSVYDSCTSCTWLKTYKCILYQVLPTLCNLKT